MSLSFNILVCHFDLNTPVIANKAFRPHRALIVETLKPARLLPQLWWVDGENFNSNISGGNCVLSWFRGVIWWNHTVVDLGSCTGNVTDVLKEGLLPTQQAARACLVPVLRSNTQCCDSWIRNVLFDWYVWIMRRAGVRSAPGVESSSMRVH